jgi:hypothetical protein
MTARIPSSVWDYPPTDTELDQFYGVPVDQFEISEVIGRHAARFDACDYGDIAATFADAINDAIRDGDLLEVGRIIAEARKQRIADLASRELYQRVGVIKKEQVVS